MELRIGVVAIVTDGKELLLVKHAKPTAWKGYWLLPGGKLQQGELLEEAVMREVQEEAGIKVRVGKLVDARISAASIQKKVGKWIVLLTYLAEPLNKQLKFPAEEIAEAKWFPLKQLPKGLYSDVIDVLRITGLYKEVQSTL